MSILHLASSTSTAFFLGESGKFGHVTFYFFFTGSIKHILEEKATISFIGKSLNSSALNSGHSTFPKTGTELWPSLL